MGTENCDQEIARQRHNKNLMAFLQKRFRSARRGNGIPLEQIQRDLGMNSDGGKSS